MLARCRELLNVPPALAEADDQEERRGATKEVPACPCCGGPMRVIERFEGPGSRRRYPGRKPDDGWGRPCFRITRTRSIVQLAAPPATAPCGASAQTLPSADRTRRTGPRVVPCPAA